MLARSQPGHQNQLAIREPADPWRRLTRLPHVRAGYGYTTGVFSSRKREHATYDSVTV
jgi:hypothetical protein